MQPNKGYEIRFDVDTCGFAVAFNSLRDSVNFCVSVQMHSLLVQWPTDILTSEAYVLAKKERWTTRGEGEWRKRG